MPRLFTVLFLLPVLATLTAHGQNRAVGQWRSHYPYNQAYALATDGVKLFVGTGSGMYTYHSINGELEAFSKVNGMSDIGTTTLGYDGATETAIVGYSNSNIDLLRKDGTFRNIPDLRLKTISGSKSINAIIAFDGVAYVSSDIGVILINLAKSEVIETWSFSQNGQLIPIKSLARDDQFFYAATPQGLYRAPKNSLTLRAFASWTLIPGAESLTGVVVTGNNRVYTSGTDSLFEVQPGGLVLRHRTNNATLHLDAGAETIYLSVFRPGALSQVWRVNAATGALSDSFIVGVSRGVVETIDRSVWIADEYQALAKKTATSVELFRPDGPGDESSFDILAYDKNVWVAHGGFNDFSAPRGNLNVLSQFIFGGWKHFNHQSHRILDDSNVTDAVALAKDPTDGALLAGTVGSGIVRVAPDGAVSVIQQPQLRNNASEPDFVGASGLAFDAGKNLWVTQHRVPEELAVRTPAGEWFHHSVFASRPIANAAAGIIVDDNNLKWYYGPQSGGVFVYDDAGTPETSVDDRYRQLKLGEGLGNLPSNKVLCLTKDRDNTIWIGTDNGIGIVNCPSQALDGTCESEQRIVQYDQFAGYLFQNEAVSSIAVDGANRKWVGTSNGVWLISPSGNAIISRFNTANSPLPSDRIQKIGIDPVTGDVYIGTDAGLVSYRGTATDAAENTDDKLITFPNPVPSGYSGTIAITGFPENADVRITDIAGQLVFRTTANGGQATWSGKDYTGRRPQSGVYLIFGTTTDGTDTRKGKIIFME